MYFCFFVPHTNRFKSKGVFYLKKLLTTTLVVLITLTLILTGCGANSTDKNSDDSSANESKVFKIGISQYVEHPALDAAREGFIEGLKEEGFEEGKNVEFSLENAQADFPTTQTIAKKFSSENVDLILAIATPSAQSAANVTKDIPILITAVTDPVSAGLVKSLETPETNVTGTTDMNPVKQQFELLKEILPDAKNVGIVFNAAEANSKVQVDIAKEAAKELGLTIVEANVSNSSEVNQAIQTIADRIDAIYVPTDNTVASAIGAVVKICNDAKIPVIGSERAHIDNGGLATIGIDYFLLGKQTGKMAARVLKGEKPAEIPVEDSKDLKLIVNKKAAAAIGIDVPEAVLSKADEVIE